MAVKYMSMLSSVSDDFFIHKNVSDKNMGYGSGLRREFSIEGGQFIVKTCNPFSFPLTGGKKPINQLFEKLQDRWEDGLLVR